MNNRVVEMPHPAQLTVSAVLAAIEMINAIEVGHLKGGVDFVELVIGPNVEDMKAADVIAYNLLRKGMGIKLSLHWPFKGSLRWAVQTDKTRVVNTGM